MIVKYQTYRILDEYTIVKEVKRIEKNDEDNDDQDIFSWLDEYSIMKEDKRIEANDDQDIFSWLDE